MAQSVASKKKAPEWVFWTVLVVVVLGVIGMLRFVTPGEVIMTGSMSPTMPAGTIVLDEHVSSVHVGDVITARDPADGSKVTHRVVAVQADGTIVTKGDANKTVDVHPTPLKINNVIGKVIFHIQWWWLVLIIAGGILLAMMVVQLLKKDEILEMRSESSDPLDAPSPASISA